MLARLMGLATISPADVLEHAQASTIAVFDVNAHPRWLAEHVPGSRHLDPTSFAAADLPANRTAMVVFYCSGPFCQKAPNAAKRAKGMGWSDVRVMSAGISGWSAAGLPTESGEQHA